MPKAKGNFWTEFDVITDPNEKEKYKCKTCSDIWSKNASRLKEHAEKCSAEIEILHLQGTKHKRQQTLDEYKYIFIQIISESLLACAFCSAGIPFNVINNEDFVSFKKNPALHLKFLSAFPLHSFKQSFRSGI